MKEHHSQGPATALVLEGKIRFSSSTKERAMELAPLQSAVFSKDVLHAVEALEETLLLVTMGGHPKEQ